MMKVLFLLALIAVAFCTVPINNCREFASLINRNPYGSYSLQDDLDCGDFVRTIVPVFRGTLDGQGHTIRNVRIRCGNDYYCGIFGEGDGVTVSNLNLDGIFVEGDTNMGTGGLFGALSFSSLSNINLGLCGGRKNEIRNGGYIVGGIAALVRNSNLDNVSVRETLVSGAISGGVVGSITTYDLSYQPTYRSAKKQQGRTGSPAPIVSSISNAYNFGFSGNWNSLIVSATPSGLATTIYGYASQVVFQTNESRKQQKQSNSTKSTEKSQPRFFIPPINYVGETWAGGIAGLAFGTNLQNVGTFAGTVLVSRNGLTNAALPNDIPRFGGGGVIGVYERVAEVELSIPLAGQLDVSGYNFPSSVTADSVFAEKGVTVTAVDGALIGGVYGMVRDNIQDSTKRTKRSESEAPTNDHSARKIDENAPKAQREKKACRSTPGAKNNGQERCQVNATVILQNSYSKARLTISQTSTAFQSSYSGFAGYIADCADLVSLTKIVSSSQFVSTYSPTPLLDSIAGHSSCQKKRSLGDELSQVYYDNSINTGLFGAGSTGTGQSSSALLTTISGFGGHWHVFNGHYDFDFQFSLQFQCPEEHRPDEERPHDDDDNHDDYDEEDRHYHHGEGEDSHYHHHHHHHGDGGEEGHHHHHGFEDKKKK